MIVQEFVEYKQRTLAMINQSAEKRYLKLIETNKDVFQFAHLSHIASYLGISERTLNRIRQNFTKK
jgi:DNA-binding MurR/RpiR family transcriptional regulator